MCRSTILAPADYVWLQRVRRSRLVRGLKKIWEMMIRTIGVDNFVVAVRRWAGLVEHVHLAQFRNRKEILGDQYPAVRWRWRGRRDVFKGMWPQDPYVGSLLILPNLYVMLAFIVSPW
jgi:hypothetical protein